MFSSFEIFFYTQMGMKKEYFPLGVLAESIRTNTH